MLDNEFDQYFRDRLLNHSSRVKVGLWKQVHTHLVHYKVFHFWKWYFVGPSAVAVAITGHLLLAKPGKPAHPRLHSPASAIAPATVAASPIASTPAVATAPAPTTAPAPANAPAPTTAQAATIAPAPTIAPAATTAPVPANAPAAATAAQQQRATDLSTTNALIAQNPGNENAGEENPGAQSRSTHHHTAQNPAAPGETATRPQFAAPVKRATLSPAADIVAQTPNPKRPHQLTLPPMPRQPANLIHLDIFASPEYYSWKTLGVSYSAGIRATVVYKEHWTLTTGFQYLRTNISHPSAKDSSNGLLPGYIKHYHIPVFLGYTTGTQRFSLSANAGVIFSVDAESNVLNNPNGVTLYFGVGVSARIIPRISIFAEPHVKCWLPPGDMNLHPQIYSTGLSLGLRYNF
ncbi:MAG TPA: hypothetical protein VG605_08425 [Puia sp.]|nr:hypothetical protein [Puia sp.]